MCTFPPSKVEAYEDRPIKVVIRDLPISVETSEIIQSLEEKGYTIGRASQMKSYKEKALLPLYLIDVKKIGNYTNIFNEKQICCFRVKVVPYRKRKKAIICYNCSGFYHSVKNCHMHPRCIKCNGQHATRDCSIKEKIEEPTCINCGEKGHLAAWKGCKAHPLIQKNSDRKIGKTYAQATSNKSKRDEEPELKNAEKTPDIDTELSDLKDSLQAMKEMNVCKNFLPCLKRRVNAVMQNHTKKKCSLCLML
ncbi:hypothetical protein AVEN_110052-1 [Araneus ventricosus]|uniref:CCHC-type domain-containing protein n=1 Tax=Araneus ventricosus TaxID=182803 RepID=A0A4Y2NLR7_ARAVE|nr:hypothetical protein AVEN_110052-1 [Araneus ventricosus]